MKLWRLGAVALAISTLASLVVSSTADGATRTAAASCAVTWGSQTKAGGLAHTPPLLTARTGRHTCFDRIVFEFRGTASGYRVGYASEVYSEGRGIALSPYTAGGALLSVVLRNPAYDSAGNSVFRHTTGYHAANVAGYSTLRDVVYGGSFEGQTLFAVGVRARLPFHVYRLTGPGAHNRIVLDIAHHW
jgi:hypothetical protein